MKLHRVPVTKTGIPGHTELSSEFTPLTERLELLLVVRLFMAGVVLLASAVLSKLDLRPSVPLAAIVYLLLTLVLESLHRVVVRLGRRRGLFVVNIMLIIDGLYVAAVLAGAAQSREAFMFLAYAHIVSVTLLIGFRTGLKVALWHSILLLTAYYMSVSGWLPGVIVRAQTSNRTLSNQLEVAQAAALLMVAIVTALFGALNERELRRRKEELTIIADLSSTVERTRRPSEIMQALVDTATTRLLCTRAVVISAHAGQLIMAGSIEGVPKIEGDSLIGIGGSVAAAVETSVPVTIRHLNPVDDALLNEMFPNAENLSLIPLIAEGETLGVLIAEWGPTRKRKVTRHMVDLLHNVAGRVALSLSNTFLLAEVQRLASVDGLTGLPNRRSFNQAIEREVSRARRTGGSVSLVMLDIDHFKRVNDAHGHQMGDQVLVESATGVADACRGEDLPARYGGEEIAVIMPGCTRDNAFGAAERIRRALGSSNKSLHGLTASAGVATFPNNADDLVSLIASADEALYNSKESGRDCTTVSGRVVEPADLFENGAGIPQDKLEVETTEPSHS